MTNYASVVTLCDSIANQYLATRYYFNSFYFMMMNVFGQDGWMMNFDQNGTFRTMVWMVSQDL